MPAKRFTTILLFTSLILTASLVTTSIAVPPHPEVRQQWIDQGVWRQKVDNWKAFKAAGGSSPAEHRPYDPKALSQKRALGIQAVDTIRVIVILIDFIDQQWQNQGSAVSPAMFDSILFSNRDTDPVFNPTGSMTDFYLENSYGQFYLKGDIFGWLRMSQTYSWYVGTDDGFGHSQQLALEAVLAADSAGADYSNYDANNDGFCDGVIIIHPGDGAEAGAFGIWSHSWSFTAVSLDGVAVSDYTFNPEEVFGDPATIGIFSHEYGHTLGLPDLYDIDYEPSTADGLGVWSLMAFGSWNDDGARPAHFDAWCKYDLGFVNVVDVTSNLDSVAFPAVEYSPVVYRLSNVISLPNEYWFVENRQKYGFDAALPGSGLLIFHVDYAMQGSNVDHLRYFVALEQADGHQDLELTNGNQGDQGDPFPGSSNAREFNDYTIPNSNTSALGLPTNIGVWEISDNDSVMYADLDILLSRPFLQLGGSDSIIFDDPLPLGDGDGDLDPGETVLFFATFRNKGATVYNATINLSTNNPDVTFLDNDVPMDSDLDTTLVSNSLTPVRLLIDDSTEAVIDTFTLIVTADSLPTTPGSGEFVDTFTFTYAIGTPRVMVVDDDRGELHDTLLANVFARAGTPYKMWHKLGQGTPTGTILNNYPMVFWHTGESAANVLDSNDIAAMKQFMDNGGNLLLSTTSGVSQLQTLDSAFLHDYFKAQYEGQTSAQNIRGVAGTDLGNNTKYKAPLTIPFDAARQTMTTVTGGEPFLSYSIGSPIPTAGISYRGTYKSVLLSFPLEAIQDNAGGSWWPKDTLVDRIMFWLFDSPDSTNPRTIQSLYVIGDNQSNVLNHTPTFGWSTSLGYPGDSLDGYQLQVGTDNDWAVAEMWDSGPVASTDTFSVYAGSTLVDGATYYLRAKVKNGISWSAWYVTTFRMNSPPQAPVVLGPVNDSITTARPTLYVSNAIDAEGDFVFYIFEVYSDSNLTTLVTSDSSTLQGIDSTGWLVAITLNYETKYWWRSKASDVFEFSDYSDVATFVTQNTPQAPTTPAPISPIDTGGWPVFDLLPSFDWTDATDPNPYDEITYRLTIGLDPLFLSTINITNLPNSSHTLTPADSLEFEHQYYWRVVAADNTGLPSPASPAVSFWTWTLGDVDHSHSFDIIDLTYYIDYLFRGGPTIDPLFVGDVNADCNADILDLTYIVDRIFRGGPPPQVGCEQP